MAAVETIIVQRVIPHYRVSLFRRLHQELGIQVVTAKTPPGDTFLSLADPMDLEFAVPAPFRFPNASNPFTASVPTSWILATLRPKRVIAEFGLRMSSSYQLPWARRTGAIRRLAFWSHGWQMSRGFETRLDRWIQLARLPLFAAADAHATYTSEGAAWVRRCLPRTPVVALGNAIDLNAICKASAAALPVRHGSPQFLAVGRLTRNKRFDVMMEAFAGISTAYPGAGLTLIGDGPERDRLMTLAGARLGRSIRILDALYEEEDLAPHFLGADFCLIPGAAGLTVNHALAYNLPVVCFARTALGPLHNPEIEYVVDGKTGILAFTPSAHALAEAAILAYRKGLHKAIADALRGGTDLPTIESMTANFKFLLQILSL